MRADASGDTHLPPSVSLDSRIILIALALLLGIVVAAYIFVFPVWREKKRRAGIQLTVLGPLSLHATPASAAVSSTEDDDGKMFVGHCISVRVNAPALVKGESVVLWRCDGRSSAVQTVGVVNEQVGYVCVCMCVLVYGLWGVYVS